MNDAIATTATPGSVPRPVERRSELGTWLGFMALTLGNFIAVLDIQIVGSSINELQAGLSCSADEIHWIQTSYLMAELIAIPLCGTLSRLLSTRVYFTIATAGFTLASVACACSWNLGSMVVFRILQGFLGGGMVPSLFAALYMMFPDQGRVAPRLIAGMTTMLAPALGPAVGGYITDIASWHWLFLINLIPGSLTAFLAWRWLNFDHPEPELRRTLDIPGAVYLAVFLGALEYTLDEGPRNDWLADTSVCACIVIATVGGLLFFMRMASYAHPIVDLRAFRDRNFAAGSAIVTVFGISVYSLMYLTPLFLGEVRGFSPSQIATVMMVQGLAMLASAPIIMPLSRHLDERVQISIGMLALAAGCWHNAYMSADWGFEQLILPQALRGFGNVTTFVSLANVALGTMERSEVKNASSLFNVLRNIGGAIGLALITTLMNDRLWLHWQRLAETTTAANSSFREGLRTLSNSLQHQLGSGSDAAAVGILSQQAQQQALTMAFNDLNWLLAISLVLGLPLLLLIRKPRKDLDVDAIH